MKNMNFEPGRAPDQDALAAELANERCGNCGDQATTRCVGISANKSYGLVMYLCEPCADKFMAFLASGCMTDYDANRYRQRSDN